MKRPKRLNYPNGIYGDISYTEQLNKYITYLENKNQALQLLQPDVMLSLRDIRNKLSPITNLITILENGLVKGNVEMHDLVLKEIEQCKKSIAYLSGNEA